jgi:thiol-disulfide isomerase/thioredoxin
MKTNTSGSRLGRRAALAAALTLVAAGCAAESDGAAGTAALKPIVATGAFTAAIDGGSFTVDVSGKKVTVLAKHKINEQAGGFACVPELTLEVEGGTYGACGLQLAFKADFDGVLVLDTARFVAKGAIFQDGVAIDTAPCEGWTQEPAKGEVAYEGSNPEVELTMSPIPYPQAAEAKATLRNVLLNPKGKVELRYKGRKFVLDLDPIKFEGDLESEGSSDVTCAQTWQPLPAFDLEDINPKSPHAGESYGLDRFKGRYVVALMGAGWCASCISQVEYMQKIKADLEAKGRNDFVMVAINDKSAAKASDQKQICGKQGQATFPIFQATSTYGWQTFVDPQTGKPGAKNDAFIYAPDGRFLFKHIGKATVNLGQFEQEVRDGLNLQPE